MSHATYNISCFVRDPFSVSWCRLGCVSKPIILFLTRHYYWLSGPIHSPWLRVFKIYDCKVCFKSKPVILTSLPRHSHQFSRKNLTHHKLATKSALDQVHGKLFNTSHWSQTLTDQSIRQTSNKENFRKLFRNTIVVSFSFFPVCSRHN